MAKRTSLAVRLGLSSRRKSKKKVTGLRLFIRRALAYTFTLLAILLITPLLLVGVYTFMPVPVTPLMLLRLTEGHGLNSGLPDNWVPLNAVPKVVPRALIAAEDNLYCQHKGFDWKSLNKAYALWERHGEIVKGGSTISQQTAKNVFLWHGHSAVSKSIRKGLEFPLTALIEQVWGKQRILEVYMNVVEWGPGVYGIRAAAKYHFNTTPDKLTKRQATLLAAVLPSPRRWNAGKPGPYVKHRARALQVRINTLGPLYDCLPGRK